MSLRTRWLTAVLALCAVSFLVSASGSVEMGSPEWSVWIVRSHGGQEFGIPVAIDGTPTVDPRQHEGAWKPQLRLDGHYCTWTVGYPGEFTIDAGGSDIGSVCIRVVPRLGDVNADGSVDLTDVMSVKSHNRQQLTEENCRYDVNVDGYINLIDAALVEAAIP